MEPQRTEPPDDREPSLAGVSADASADAAGAPPEQVEAVGDPLAAWLARMGRRALDLLLPAQCPASDMRVLRPGDLAPEAWSAVQFIAPPHCATCGVPFSYDYGAGAICASCAAAPPAFDRARAAFVYGERSRALILRFKHGDRWDAVEAFGRWMARAGAEVLEEADYIAPTPLHWRRLHSRRFNQSAVLAQAIVQQAPRPLALDLLKRKRATPTQGGLSAEARKRNVAGAFAVSDKWRGRIEGAHIVLIDDVLTTGATLSACAKTLKRAGATKVDALVLARTAPKGAATIG